MANIFRKGGDQLWNGTVLGGVAGLILYYGDKLNLSQKISDIMTNKGWMFAGDWTVPIIMIGAGLVIGYVIDRI